jgi:hypothetical protein
MGIVNNQGVFIAPPLGEGEETILTSFRDDDDFSTDIFDESVVLPDLPENIGVAFVRSSDSPADFATIALQGTNTSTIYIENTAGQANFVVSNDVYIGYKSGITTTANIIDGNPVGDLYVNKDIQVDGDIQVGGTAYGDFQGTINIQSWKGFDIQHPTKTNYRLRHICLEGPEGGVYFRGRLTNSNVIELPNYWTNFVDPESITVTLTQIGYSQDLIVEKIEWGKKIIIKSGTGSNIDCYYVIHGARIDGDKLIVEYEGESPSDYPGDSSQYSIAGYDYGRKL